MIMHLIFLLQSAGGQRVMSYARFDSNGGGVSLVVTFSRGERKHLSLDLTEFPYSYCTHYSHHGMGWEIPNDDDDEAQ